MSSLQKLPPYLRKYVVEQDYDKYTSVEHATWRYIMRQSREFFGKHAVSVYQEGLNQTGIPIDRIPRIEEMDEKLAKFGWGAAGVEGFIPSSVFLDLLARGIMPIACDMRTLEHVGYTPAPDIVHEAAGHAPIVTDPAYREFLNRYASMAYRALISAEDIKMYEAIRYLSDIKENPDVPQDEIAKAEKQLEEVGNSMTFLSEAGKVARMAWWTTEYGLVGDMKSPKIYGAGLLSSIEESKNCLSDKVKKIPLTVDCINQTYDITEPQPQLFVAKSLDDLPNVLAELENTFAFKMGGKAGLEEMQRSDTVNCVQFASGLSVSGRLMEFDFSERFGLESLTLTEYGQFCFNEVEIPGYGRNRFSSGLRRVFGRFKNLPEISTDRFPVDALSKIGIAKNSHARIEYANGYVVDGQVVDWIESEGVVQVINMRGAQVSRGDKVLTTRDQGAEYSLLLGEVVASVFAGPGDRETYGDYYVGKASTTPGRTSPYTAEEKQIIGLFERIRNLRENKIPRDELEQQLKLIVQEILKLPHPNWLLALEVAELAEQRGGLQKNHADWLETLHHSVLNDSLGSVPETGVLVARGLEIIAVPD